MRRAGKRGAGARRVLGADEPGEPAPERGAAGGVRAAEEGPGAEDDTREQEVQAVPAPGGDLAQRYAVKLIASFWELRR